MDRTRQEIGASQNYISALFEGLETAEVYRALGNLQYISTGLGRRASALQRILSQFAKILSHEEKILAQ